MIAYFLILAICQISILIFFIVVPVKSSTERLKIFSITPKHLSVLNLLAAIAIFSINRMGQFFCVPVDWSATVLIIFALSMIIYPLLDDKNKANYFISFSHGIGLLICVYCIIFYLSEAIGGLILAFFLGLIIYLPSLAISQIVIQVFKITHVKSKQIIILPAFFIVIVVGLPFIWLGQIIKRFLKSNNIHRVIILSTCIILLIFTSFFVKAYQNIVDNRDAILKVETRVVNEIKSNFFGDYMLEKAIGWGLVYHVEICIYDGWRPPMHDPFLVISNWIVNKGEPLSADFQVKKSLYKQFYPQIPIKKKCSCGIEESNTYFSDPVFQ